MSGSVNRLSKELKELGERGKQDSKAEIVLFPQNPNDLFYWTAFIHGPPGSPYEGFRFQLRMSVPKTYPHNPPKVSFITKICHPNVHFKTGEICLDVLKDGWTPIWTLESTCRAVIVLLGNPEASSPLNCDCGNLIRSGDLRGYNSLARFYCEEHAVALNSPSPSSSSSSSSPSSSSSSSSAVSAS